MKENEIKKIGDEILGVLFRELGYCGHCGKKECGGKSSHIKLPDTLPTKVVWDAITEVTGC